jgi:hypothetical protein
MITEALEGMEDTVEKVKLDQEKANGVSKEISDAYLHKA